MDRDSDHIAKALDALDPRTLHADFIAFVICKTVNRETVVVRNKRDIRAVIDGDVRLLHLFISEIIPDTDRMKVELQDEVDWMRDRIAFMMADLPNGA